MNGWYDLLFNNTCYHVWYVISQDTIFSFGIIFRKTDWKIAFKKRDKSPNIQGRKTPGSNRGDAECARKTQRIARKCKKSQNAPIKLQGKEHAEKAQSHKETIPVYLVFERFRYSERRGAYKNLHPGQERLVCAVIPTLYRVVVCIPLCQIRHGRCCSDCSERSWSCYIYAIPFPNENEVII